ncbi:F0F1 ATP synthase subunit delta, partial [Siminovitchia fortis]|uniref:F0F1 ATP synthase subunit delta n=1 Tax=Siminovitchia fortis TaxID=254758 RepID=UPI0036F44952
NAGFINVLECRKVSLEEKRNVIGKSFGKVSVRVINSVMLLGDGEREKMMVEVGEWYMNGVNEEGGIGEGTVY